MGEKAEKRLKKLKMTLVARGSQKKLGPSTLSQKLKIDYMPSSPYKQYH